MTDKIRRMTITIQRHDITIVRSRKLSHPVNCGRCSSNVHGLTLIDAAELLRVPITTINDLINADAIHFIHTPEVDRPLICGDFALQQISIQKPEGDSK